VQSVSERQVVAARSAQVELVGLGKGRRVPVGGLVVSWPAMRMAIAVVSALCSLTSPDRTRAASLLRMSSAGSRFLSTSNRASRAPIAPYAQGNTAAHRRHQAAAATRPARPLHTMRTAAPARRPPATNPRRMGTVAGGHPQGDHQELHHLTGTGTGSIRPPSHPHTLPPTAARRPTTAPPKVRQSRKFDSPVDGARLLDQPGVLGVAGSGRPDNHHPVSYFDGGRDDGCWCHAAVWRTWCSWAA
jgi:hypothetical protein